MHDQSAEHKISGIGTLQSQSNRIIPWIIFGQMKTCYIIITGIIIIKLRLTRHVSMQICMASETVVFSERELKFMFAICHRPSVCRLSSVCLSSAQSILQFGQYAHHCPAFSLFTAPYSDD